MCSNNEILHFRFADALQDLPYLQCPPLHGQMQRHGHKPMTAMEILHFRLAKALHVLPYLQCPPLPGQMQRHGHKPMTAMEILHFRSAKALHNLPYLQCPPLHGQMQRHGHIPMTAIYSQMTGLYLINTCWQKSKCNSQKSSEKNVNECRNTGSMDLASPLHRISEDVHSYFEVCEKRKL